MKLRSMLFVPADSERKLAKSGDSGADALILDLEDAVAAPRKALARSMAADHIRQCAGKSGPALFVRINPLDTHEAMADLAAVCLPGLAGVMLPKMRSHADIVRLSHGLDALEAAAGIAPCSVMIVPVATETPQAVLGMASMVPMPRLTALTWGAEDLSAAIGSVSNRDAEGGGYSPLYEWAGSLCLAAAAATKALAIDTLYSAFRDETGLRAACRLSRRRGFRGRIAIHPDQVAVINEAYTPSEHELVYARRIVDAFAAHPEAGTLAIDGEMVDLPHLAQARRTLGMT